MTTLVFVNMFVLNDVIHMYIAEEVKKGTKIIKTKVCAD